MWNKIEYLFEWKSKNYYMYLKTFQKYLEMFPGIPQNYVLYLKT